MKLLPVPLLLLFLAACLHAQTPQEVRRIPPPGIAIPEADRAELTAGVEALRKEIAASKLPANELPNVEIFLKAVDWALRYDEFFDVKQIPIAREQLAQGHARLAALQRGETPWNSATGLVVRGYRSKIDGSVQPYGLVVPANWKPTSGSQGPLHIWLHGRGEKLSELAFLAERQRSQGDFAPEDAIVCHLYGRYCNANKFAGETDLFEALADLQHRYLINPSRIVIRGFSMGGAACWQFATHHPGRWAAAAPGAGFAETAEFFKVFAPGKTPPPWWEQVLWRWYDCPTMAGNLFNVPTIAYSGELDGQKQAADIMLRAAATAGVEIPHIIGLGKKHEYHPDSKPLLDDFVRKASVDPRPPAPRRVEFTTYSLIYHECDWVKILAMDRQWERAEVDVEVDAEDVVHVRATNVTRLELRLDPLGPLVGGAKRIVVADGPTFEDPAGYLHVTLRKEGSRWTLPGYTVAVGKGARGTGHGLVAPGLDRKGPGLCGPIDHAFMSSFLFVRPTGQPLNEKVGGWAKAELEHATEFWRRVFRGEAPVKDDTAITDDDLKNNNLVLWGDPSSNAVFKKIADRLPIQWTKDTLVVNGVKYDTAHHTPILIFPNPLNPAKYIVLNSGPTFRERALLNNSDQTPKLPDWAVVDLRTPPDAQWPGLVVDAGFFDEEWRWRK